MNNSIHRRVFPGAVCLFLIAVGVADGGQLPKLRISDNQRFLAKDDGTAFIWIGDTIWDFQQLTPQQLDEYLDVRASQGYTVIQMQVASYGTESFRKNYRGDWCFGGPMRKDITQPQEAWFQHADAWLDKIEQHGLYAALGLGWIINYFHVYDKAGDPAKRFSKQDFYNYGKWIGNRYKDRNNIIWLGLNESTYMTTPVEKVKAVCRGIRDGDTGDKLLTLHPQAGTRTSDLFGDIVDFNSWQTARFLAPKNLPFWRSVPGVDDKLSGALVKNTFRVWEAIADDYNRTPVKPVIDLEAWFEGAVDDMPVGQTGTRATAWHCRRRAYFTIFAGSFGHTYGADSLAWQIKGDGWRKGLYLPGGKHVGHIAKLLGDPQRPFLKLVPDQGLITAGQSRSYDSHKQAARDGDGSYAYVYSANGSEFSVDLTRLRKERAKIAAQWFDPREDTYQPAGGPYDRAPSQAFDPPGSPAVDNDWVLVLSALPPD